MLTKTTNITYDTKVHKVTFQVVDDGNGNLCALKDTALIQTVKFTNTYKKDVDTGDDNNLMAYALMMFTSGITFLYGLVSRRRRRQKKA